MLNLLSLPRPDLLLLLLCMKLILWLPSEHEDGPDTALYHAAKQFYLKIEMAGVMSVQTLQAGILIAHYEFGHAMYPSAFMSVGAAVRQGYVLGINPKHTPCSKNRPLGLNWKKGRWTVLVLDRYANLLFFP